MSDVVFPHDVSLVLMIVVLIMMFKIVILLIFAIYPNHIHANSCYFHLSSFAKE